MGEADSKPGVETEVTLERGLGLFDASMIGIGAMIGAGIFVLTGIAAGEAGPAAVLSFALNGVVTLLTALCYAELASAYPRSGGGYSYIKKAFSGPTSSTRAERGPEQLGNTRFGRFPENHSGTMFAPDGLANFYGRDDAASQTNRRKSN